MSKLRFEISISADGFVAGPNQSEEHPLGEGGEQLHAWVVKLDAWRGAHGHSGGEANASSAIVAEAMVNVGAVIMGRNMFGGGPGPWDPEWHGWWGEDPPYHAPVFVLAHRPRESVEMQGGTVFHFVTEGIEPALALAREAAGERDVSIAGGPGTTNQYLAAGLIDELRLHVTPVVVGRGERLFAGVGHTRLRLLSSRCTPEVNHLTYGKA